MVVEHIFVTTYDLADAMDMADDVLLDQGFKASSGTGPAREWTRGLTTAKNNVRVSDLPQRVRMEFDRGRVMLAASIEERHREKTKLHEALLLGVAGAVEARLAGQSLEQSRALVAAPQADIEKLFRRQRTGRRIAIGFLLAIILGIVVLCVVAATHP